MLSTSLPWTLKWNYTKRNNRGMYLLTVLLPGKKTRAPFLKIKSITTGLNSVYETHTWIGHGPKISQTPLHLLCDRILHLWYIQRDSQSGVGCYSIICFVWFDVFQHHRQLKKGFLFWSLTMSLGSLVFVFHIILKTWLILYEGLHTINQSWLSRTCLYFLLAQTRLIIRNPYFSESMPTITFTNKTIASFFVLYGSGKSIHILFGVMVLRGLQRTPCLCLGKMWIISHVIIAVNKIFRHKWNIGNTRYVLVLHTAVL